MPIEPLASLAAAGDQLSPLITRHLDRAFRSVLRGSDVVVGPQRVRLVTGEPHPFGNFSVLSGTPEPALLEQEMNALSREDVPTAMLFVDAVPAALFASLERRGFHPHPPMPAMAVEIDRLNADGAPPGCALVRVGAGPDGSAWEDVFARGYGLPPAVAACFGPNRAEATLDEGADFQFFLVTKHGRPVATSALCLLDGVAGIYCVATVPEERRQGFGAYATAEALRRARPHGYRVGVLQASEAGLPVYRRLGFGEFGAVPLYVRMPGPGPTP